jgi:hypothetical protein
VLSAVSAINLAYFVIPLPLKGLAARRRAVARAPSFKLSVYRGSAGTLPPTRSRP